MKSLILVFMCFLLSGCVTMSPCIEQPVVTKYKYIVIDIPDNMTSIPEKVKDIDVNNSTDLDASKWLIESEQRSSKMELQLISIKQYIANRIKLMKIPEEDIVKK